MKHTLKLLTLSLLAVIFLGCVKANPYLGKWHGNDTNGIFVVEILEGGNVIVNDSGGDLGVGEWFTKAGGILVEIEDRYISGFLHDGSLLLSSDGKTLTLKRVNQ